MPGRGRPRLSAEDLQARIAAYCERYGVTRNADGLPRFPAGKRETRQHRDWIAVYKAHDRLARRQRGQCERCAAPASNGSVFCEMHAQTEARSHNSSVGDRRAVLDSQGGRCPICARDLDLSASVLGSPSAESVRAVLHTRCQRLVGLAEAVGPEALDRLRAFLWPDAAGQRPRKARP
jgi:hypothetical protein